MSPGALDEMFLTGNKTTRPKVIEQEHGKICSNCQQPFKLLATIKPDGKGGWRHPEKCGKELDDLKVRRATISRQEK